MDQQQRPPPGVGMPPPPPGSMIGAPPPPMGMLGVGVGVGVGVGGPPPPAMVGVGMPPPMMGGPGLGMLPNYAPPPLPHAAAAVAGKALPPLAMHQQKHPHHPRAAFQPPQHQNAVLIMHLPDYLSGVPSPHTTAATATTAAASSNANSWNKNISTNQSLQQQQHARNAALRQVVGVCGMPRSITILHLQQQDKPDKHDKHKKQESLTIAVVRMMTWTGATNVLKHLPLAIPNVRTFALSYAPGTPPMPGGSPSLQKTFHAEGPFPQQQQQQKQQRETKEDAKEKEKEKEKGGESLEKKHEETSSPTDQAAETNPEKQDQDKVTTDESAQKDTNKDKASKGSTKAKDHEKTTDETTGENTTTSTTPAITTPPAAPTPPTTTTTTTLPPTTTTTTTTIPAAATTIPVLPPPRPLKVRMAEICQRLQDKYEGKDEEAALAATTAAKTAKQDEGGATTKQDGEQQQVSQHQGSTVAGQQDPNPDASTTTQSQTQTQTEEIPKLLDPEKVRAAAGGTHYDEDVDPLNAPEVLEAVKEFKRKLERRDADMKRKRVAEVDRRMKIQLEVHRKRIMEERKEKAKKEEKEMAERKQQEEVEGGGVEDAGVPIPPTTVVAPADAVAASAVGPVRDSGRRKVSNLPSWMTAGKTTTTTTTPDAAPPLEETTPSQDTPKDDTDRKRKFVPSEANRDVNARKTRLDVSTEGTGGQSLAAIRAANEAADAAAAAAAAATSTAASTTTTPSATTAEPDLSNAPKETLFATPINWSHLQSLGVPYQTLLQKFIAKKIEEYTGEEEETLIEFITQHVDPANQGDPGSLLEELSMVLDDAAEGFVVGLWRRLLCPVWFMKGGGEGETKGEGEASG